MLLPGQGMKPAPVSPDLARHFTALDAAGSVGIWTCDPHGTLEWLGGSISRNLGVTTQALQSAGLVARMPPGEALEQRVQQWQHAVATGNAWSAPLEVLDAEGRLQLILLRAQPVVGPDGAIERWLGTWDFPRVGSTPQFATPRRLQALQRAEDRFRLLVDAVQDYAIFMLDPDGIVVSWNSGAERINGYRTEEILGSHFSRFYTAVDLQAGKPELELQVAQSQGRFEEEGWRLRKDGSAFLAHVILTAMHDDAGALVGFAKVTHDVTRERETEALREARDRLDGILRSVTDGILAQDVHGVVFANDAAARLLGVADALVLHRSPESLRAGLATLRTPDGAEVPFDQLPPARVLAGQPSPEVLFRQGQSLRPRWLTFKSTPVESGVAQQRLAISILHDVTDLREAEERVRGSQKMEAIGRLAGGIAHDFNNLLTAINGYSELLLQQMSQTDPSRAFLSEIRRAGERAASLTKQLLAYSRRQVLAPRHFNLNSVVAEMDKLLRRLIGEHIELVTHLETRLGTVHADVSQVEQVLVNLAVNARDAMEGGGKLFIETANALVPEGQPGPVPPGDWVTLSVRDTGRGMDAETRARIFEPFFTTKEFGKGTGLGLSTVEGIVQQSGGLVTVESEPGQGTSFRICFPRVDARRSSIEPAAIEEAQVRRGHETVLVVEDEDPVRALAQRMLEQSGYTVLVARDGEDALRQAEDEAQRIDLVLTDVVMPKMNGNELAQRLLARRSGLRVVFMSGYTDDVIVRRGLPETQTSFLQKPFSIRQLQAAIRNLLDDAPGA
jgi:two-component system cell cycle sensor histidine kinase/response regulator CckA